MCDRRGVSWKYVSREQSHLSIHITSACRIASEMEGERLSLSFLPSRLIHVVIESIESTLLVESERYDEN